MSPSRRAILKSAGAAGTVLVAGGLVWRATSTGVFEIGEGDAYTPWADWQEGPDGPMALVRAAILAANAHNTQPWRFRVSEGRIDVYADTARNLGTFDPYLREMQISLGCAIENMCIAAPSSGLSATVHPNPGDLGPLAAQAAFEPAASLMLSPSGDTPHAHYAAVPRRGTHRGAYEVGRLLSEQAQSEMARMAEDENHVRLFLFQDTPSRATLGDLIIASTKTIIGDEEMSRDSHRWFRMDWKALQKHRDGVTLDAFGLPPLINALPKIAPAPSREQSDGLWLSATRDTHVGTAPLLGMIAVRGLYDKAQNLAAGRLWQRLHLWATPNNISVHPLNQPVELVDRQRQLGEAPTAATALAEITGDPDWHPTFAFRAGYAAHPPRHSPRRAVDDVVLEI